jgi:hypothetical protein
MPTQALKNLVVMPAKAGIHVLLQSIEDVDGTQLLEVPQVG